MTSLARGMHVAGAAAPAIDNALHRSILTAHYLGSERRHDPTAASVRLRVSHQSIQMPDASAQSIEKRIASVVQRLLAEHSIDRAVGPDEDLRLAGLSSLDMVSLVLSVEEEFDLMVPETSIMPSNFRSIAAIGRLVESLRRNG